MDTGYSVIIPVQKNTERGPAVVQALLKQKIVPRKIVVAASSASGVSASDISRLCGRAGDFLEVNTGDEGILINASLPLIDTPFVWILSPEAIPTGSDVAGKILDAFADEDVAAVCTRQCSDSEKAGISAAFMQAFYGSESRVKSEKDIFSRGMDTFFLSHISCMYRTADLKTCGTLPAKELSFYEHIVGADLIHMGKKIVYLADAEVRNSHTLTPALALHEGFDYGVMQKRNIQAFGLYVIDDGSYGVIQRTLSDIYREAFKDARKYLMKSGGFFKVPGAWLCYLGLKYGNILGRRYHRLPAKMNRALCSKKDYFV